MVENFPLIIFHTPPNVTNNIPMSQQQTRINLKDDENVFLLIFKINQNERIEDYATLSLLDIFNSSMFGFGIR